MAQKTMNINLNNNTSVVIRRLRSGDNIRLQNFNKNLSKETRKLFSPHAYDNETVAKIIMRSESDEDRVYIAVDGETVVAYFFLWWFKTEFPVLGIGITDQYQGCGLGKKIMLLLLNDAKAADCNGVELTTVMDNEKALSLYEKVGFKRLGVVENLDGSGNIIKEWHLLYSLKPNIKPPDREHGPPV